MIEVANDNKYRYRIKQIIDALPPNTYAEIKKHIKKVCKISDSSYSRYINMRDNDTADMPASVLKEFAKILHVSTDDLYNTK